MAKTLSRPESDRQARQIVGISLTPELASVVKMEAARRGMTLKKLFEEMWNIYRQKNDKSER